MTLGVSPLIFDNWDSPDLKGQCGRHTVLQHVRTLEYATNCTWTVDTARAVYTCDHGMCMTEETVSFGYDTVGAIRRRHKASRAS